MPGFRWTGAAGDEAPAGQKQNWAAPLPPPPREVYALCDQAERRGLWLKWCRDPVALRRFGTRYRLVKAGTNSVAYLADDLAEIRDYLEHLEVSRL
jgi:hypothetical protein